MARGRLPELVETKKRPRSLSTPGPLLGFLSDGKTGNKLAVSWWKARKKVAEIRVVLVWELNGEFSITKATTQSMKGFVATVTNRPSLVMLQAFLFPSSQFSLAGRATFLMSLFFWIHGYVLSPWPVYRSETVVQNVCFNGTQTRVTIARIVEMNLG